MDQLHTPPLILVVDDDADFIEVIRAKLQAAHFNTIEANNGEEAISIVKDHKPDLVLMDIQMPVLDGIEAATKILENKETANTRILFLTNLGDSWPSVSDVNRKFAQEIGVLDYMKKGVDLDTIVARIKELLK